LRHFQAYRSAVISYRQQYYIAVNHQQQSSLSSPLASSSGLTTPYQPTHPHAHLLSAATKTITTPATSALASLPVIIDPEEEKRRTLLAKRLLLAEHKREALEQTYVALRAHFVYASQQLQTATSQRAVCVTSLQHSLTQRSRALGMLRAKLQILRDVKTVWETRTTVLQSSSGEANSNSGSCMMPMDVEKESTFLAGNEQSTPSETDENLLLTAWNCLQDDWKQEQQLVSKTTKKQALLWPCTKEPSTPYGVPLLLSTLATSAPEKSLAFGTNQAFGAKKESLVWLPNHLVNDADNTNKAAADDDILQHDQLTQQVASLQAELTREHFDNDQLWQKTMQARIRNDEWVAMICLLRQETEAVLFRHNIVMESERAQDMAERRFVESEQERRKLAAAAAEGGEPKIYSNGANGDKVHGTISSSSNGQGTAPLTDPSLTLLPPAAADDDNDGDDEGSLGEDVEDEDNDLEGKKRASAADEDMSTRKKARLV
jgi:hypothetical protein